MEEIRACDGALEHLSGRGFGHRSVAQSSGNSGAASPRACLTMSSSVKESRWWRMCSPTSAHTASSTHWPSWSQAPFWCGWPKSPATIGPSTALTIWPRVICAGDPRENVPAPDAALGPDKPGALQRQQDLLQVRLRKAGPLGDVAYRRRRGLFPKSQGEQRPARIVTTGRHLHALIVGRVAPRSAWSGLGALTASQV